MSEAIDVTSPSSRDGKHDERHEVEQQDATFVGHHKLYA